MCDDLLTVLSNSMLVIPALLPIKVPLHSQWPTHTNIKTPYALINTHIAGSASHLENAGGLGGTEEPLDSELIPDLHNTTRKF